MRSVLVSQTDYVTIACLPREFKSEEYLEDVVEVATSSSLNLKDAAEVAEMNVVEQALKEANYNKSLAAKILNIDRKTLYNKIKRFDIKL